MEGRAGQRWLLDELVIEDLSQRVAWGLRVNRELKIPDKRRMVTFEIKPVPQKTTNGKATHLK